MEKSLLIEIVGYHDRRMNQIGAVAQPVEWYVDGIGENVVDDSAVAVVACVYYP